MSPLFVKGARKKSAELAKFLKLLIQSFTYATKIVLKQARGNITLGETLYSCLKMSSTSHT